MMTFEQPEYYLLLFLLFLALALWARRNRQYVSVASHERIVQSTLISRTVVGIPFFCWFLMACLLLAALANPRSSRMTSYVTTLSKKAMVCVDASQSMGIGKRFSTMQKIKDMLHEFAEGRINKGDFLGISAYGGHRPGYRRGTGYSRVIQYPTRDFEVVHAAIDAVRPTMFGAFTAIGDGILVSIIALTETKALLSMGERYDFRKIEDNLWSIGTEDEDVEYAQEVVRAIGRQKGRYIVLFTDGLYNTGLHPAKALWFAERMGLKVHFIAYESAGATGLSPEQQRRHKEEIIEAVGRTGGMYLESEDVESVEQFLREIDRAEKAEISIKEELRHKSLRKVFTFGATAAYCIWLLSWIVWGDPL
jgi:hypothetical protein